MPLAADGSVGRAHMLGCWLRGEGSVGREGWAQRRAGLGRRARRAGGLWASGAASGVGAWVGRAQRRAGHLEVFGRRARRRAWGHASGARRLGLGMGRSGGAS